MGLGGCYPAYCEVSICYTPRSPLKGGFWLSGKSQLNLTMPRTRFPLVKRSWFLGSLRWW